VTTGRILMRNSALNLLGQMLPLVAAVIAIPPLMRGLGAERFGVLTLAWAAIGYFSLFELGLGRALTQAVAQRLGNGDQDELPAITWTALILLFAFGAVGGVLLAAITPVLTTRVLNIPPDLQRETVVSFWILAAALPLMSATVGMRGLMEAHQHFGMATMLRVPLAAFTFLGPLLLLPFSKSLVPAVSILAIGRIVGLAAHLWVCLREYPFLKQRAAFRREPTLALLRFGGWTTVSNVVSPMMVYLDRFVIGAMLTVAAVAHYVTPHEVVIKLLIVPVSLMAVALPAFASMLVSDPERMRALYDRSLRAVMLATFPVILVAVALAREGLFLWVGAVLPAESALVLQWLAIGVFVTAVAQPPLAALQSAGRPDLVAKLHIAELPIYVAGLVLLTRTFGLRGVAMVWTFRATIDMLALTWIAHRVVKVSMVPRLGGAWSVLVMLAALSGATLLQSTPGRVVYVAVTLLAFAPTAWFLLLTPTEREGVRAWLSMPRRVGPRAEEPV
jgi:O-antigen/teichoic acid export membrane protein